ncbi:hypothetical protein JOB18_017532 [Solea senegalensis]|uniref:Protein FAM171B n=2 Tax=Solea senegalensis TaxID=28829 RepID=A0AAV6RAE3_SOLSE|nr:protein FAM171B-like [Solea senegalensis]KAG7502313.1 hypothetical protein JOB18_017532 [Solea senegalensis]
MRLLMCLISALILCTNNKAAAAEFTEAVGRSLHVDDGNFSEPDQVEQEAFHHQQQVLHPLPGSVFNLKVHVDDVLSHQPVSQAVVEVYINYTKFNSVHTGENGTALLHVPDHAGLPVTVVACKDGYVCTLLPCKTSRMPIFSSVTMSLLGRNQGNIWLFEDSVMITGKTSDTVSQSVVQFPKSLLNLNQTGNLTMVEAYLTVPQLSSDGVDALSTLGIMSSKSGFVSVELSPVAAVSMQLFSGDTELHISGPVQISLSVPDSCGLQISTVVPAWFFNRTTGGWMRKGLGKVVSRDGKLMWTFTAPHLGDWIAAPLSSTRGFFEIAIPADFLLHHSSFLMVLGGGVIFVLVFLLVGLYYGCRPSLSGAEEKMTMLPMSKKDQTTSTCEDQVFEVSSMDGSQPQGGLKQSFTDSSLNVGNTRASPNDVALTLECTESNLDSESNDVTCLHKTTEQMTVPGSLAGNFFLYNQPVAILHAPAFFHLDELEEYPEWSKSATLPRAGASNSAACEPLSKDGFTQTLPKGPPSTQNTEMEAEDRLGELESLRGATAPNTSMGHFNLPESVSVPGTLNKIRDSRHSAHALGELSKSSSHQPPRAWFVSLEGKPAAEIHYAVSEQHRRRRPAESRETSLDSGVDMNELNPSSGRRAVPLERSATFVKSSPISKRTDPH